MPNDVTFPHQSFHTIINSLYNHFLSCPYNIQHLALRIAASAPQRPNNIRSSVSLLLSSPLMIIKLITLVVYNYSPSELCLPLPLNASSWHSHFIDSASDSLTPFTSSHPHFHSPHSISISHPLASFIFHQFLPLFF